MRTTILAITTKLTLPQVEVLERIAQSRNLSRHQILREAIAEYISKMEKIEKKFLEVSQIGKNQGDEANALGKQNFIA